MGKNIEGRIRRKLVTKTSITVFGIASNEGQKRQHQKTGGAISSLLLIIELYRYVIIVLRIGGKLAFTK